MCSFALCERRKLRCLKKQLLIAAFCLFMFEVNTGATRIEAFETTFQLDITKNQGLQYWTEENQNSFEEPPRSICGGFLLLLKATYATLAEMLAGCKNGFHMYTDSGIEGNLTIYIMQFQIRPTTLETWRAHVEDTLLELVHQHLRTLGLGSPTSSSTIALKDMRMLPIEVLTITARVSDQAGRHKNKYIMDLKKDFHLLMNSIGMLNALIAEDIDENHLSTFTMHLDYEKMVNQDLDLCGPIMLEKWKKLLIGSISAVAQTGFIQFREVEHAALCQIDIYLRAPYILPQCNGSEKEMVSLVLVLQDSGMRDYAVKIKNASKELETLRSKGPINDVIIAHEVRDYFNNERVYVYMDVQGVTKLIPEIASESEQVRRLANWFVETKLLVPFGYQVELYLREYCIQAHKVCYDPYYPPE